MCTVYTEMYRTHGSIIIHTRRIYKRLAMQSSVRQGIIVAQCIMLKICLLVYFVVHTLKLSDAGQYSKI